MPNFINHNAPQSGHSAGFASEFAMSGRSCARIPKGLSRAVIEMLSTYKSEPPWMLDARLRAFEIFKKKPMPSWGNGIVRIDFDDIYYYSIPSERVRNRWEDVPPEIKKTFDLLGVPSAEKNFLAGSGAQYDSEAVYHNIQQHLNEKGVIFLDTDTALRKHPELFKEYFGTVVPAHDNKFAALNSAVWSGGSVIYVPRGVRIEQPLQAYFRINAERLGQFERTLIIADEESYLHYVEGCTAPAYTTNSLHSAVVEIIVKPRARVRYTTIQNWSKNVYNLVTKRAHVYEDGIMEWVDGNLGSALTMKYPSAVLLGPRARGSVLSLASAGAFQRQDAGGKIIHKAPHTSSMITSKSISFCGGRTSYRGLIKILPSAHNSNCYVSCDALILDEKSGTDTYPTMDIRAHDAAVSHEASVSKIGDEQLFYLQSRGLDEAQSRSLIVNGFMEPITKELPMEYAVELNRLIQMEMQNAVG